MSGDESREFRLARCRSAFRELRSNLLGGPAAADAVRGQARFLTVNEGSLRYEGWRVAFASSVGVFVSFASLLVYTFGIFLKPLAEEFAWSREAISSAFGIAAMTAAVCSPPRVLPRSIRPRWIIVPSLTIFGSAFASLSLLTRRLWHIYAIFVILGMVANGSAQMAYARTVSSWFARRRGVALAVVMSGGAVGAMVLLPVAQSLIDWLGWRGASVSLGAMVLVVGLPTVCASYANVRPGMTL
jgi:MFS family permease